MGLRIVFFDCDGTLTTVKSSWQYLHERLDLWDRKADEFQRLFQAGQIGYAEFCRRDAALWKGLSLERVLRIMGDIPLHEGVRETMEALRAQGILTVLLSTGLSFLVDKVRRELDMTLAVANDLIVREGVLTGEVMIQVDHDQGHPSGPALRQGPEERGSSGPIPAGEHSSGAGGLHTKGYWVKKLLGEWGIGKEEAAAVGDGEGDRGMFEEVGLAIGYQPSAGILPLLDHACRNGSFREVHHVLGAHR
jgi:phosphoserine phosphatase